MSVKGSHTLHKPAAGKLQWSKNITEVKYLFESCCLTAFPSTCLLCLWPTGEVVFVNQLVSVCSALSCLLVTREFKKNNQQKKHQLLEKLTG